MLNLSIFVVIMLYLVIVSYSCLCTDHGTNCLTVW